jgi:hypothetical protein
MKKEQMIDEIKDKLFVVDVMRKWIGRVKRKQLTENKTTELVVAGLGTRAKPDVIKASHEELREVLVWIRACEHGIREIEEIRAYHPMDMWERMFLIGTMDDLREVIMLKRRMNVFMRLIKDRPKQVSIKRIKEEKDERAEQAE